MSIATSSALARARVRVRGTVQGVGFRPFVYRLAGEERLAGYVLNDERGVLLEIEGDGDAVARFALRLVQEAPPLAVIEGVESERVPVRGEEGFRIVESVRGGEPDAPVTPDSATCADCLAELFDPADRRYRYPFTNCTNCGPRFTIVCGVPYDRPQTTMAAFQMCPQCEREYHDPADRRFHAQPNACPECGPRVWLQSARESLVPGDPIASLASRLKAGQIAAIKGIGGFHLACDAAGEDAVATLRARKHRDDKPFAVMVSGVEAARALVELDAEAEQLLSSVARPIVLAPRRSDARVAAGVAPGARELGVMLPYSPLHHLLLADFGRALVMTSGNLSDDPIAFTNEDAIERLSPIADVLLLHDREIHARTDDSVLRAGAMLRRSRGYVPGALALPVETAKPVLACGAQQKNTFCLAKGRRAWVSHHIGDLEHYAALRAYEHGIGHFERLFAVTPELVVHDLHPGYQSTAYALERDGVATLGVQHHHAHLAACLAEHGLTEPAVGAIFDGTGYGLDGSVWGGELLVGDLRDFRRVGALWPVRLPGGAAAIREPWRMACAWLSEAFGEPRWVPRLLRGRVDDRAWVAIPSVVASAEHSPSTTSVGRLFDAVGALCGLAPKAAYEGQAAVELEWAAARASSRSGAYELPVTQGVAPVPDGVVLDPRAAIRQASEELEAGFEVADVAASFHRAVAHATVSACGLAARGAGLGTIVLSGGVFQNKILLELVRTGLERDGLRVLTPRLLPANDGGISFGQAAIAAAGLT
jgi:hydrogenase maturation protein HypF